MYQNSKHNSNILGRSVHVSSPIWIHGDWDEKIKAFTYPKEFSKSKNESLKVLDTEYMKDEIVKRMVDGKVVMVDEYPVVGLRYKNPVIFGLSSLRYKEGLTVCRKEPLISYGIKTLNLMLDPAKEPEREQTVKAKKEEWIKKFGNLNFTQAYEKLFELLWYSRLPCVDVRDVTSKERDEMSIIKRCYWRGELVDCASIFVTRSTDRGMCCAFNVGNANEIYKSTNYGVVTKKMQTKMKEQSFPGLPKE